MLFAGDFGCQTKLWPCQQLTLTCWGDVSSPYGLLSRDVLPCSLSQGEMLRGSCVPISLCWRWVQERGHWLYLPWGVNIPSPAWEGDYWRAVVFCAQNSLPSLQDCVKHSGYLKNSCCSSRCTKALEERSLIYSDGFFMTSFFPKILCHCDFPLCSYSCHRTWVWPFGPFPHFLLSSPLSLPFIFYFFMFIPKVRVLLKNLAWLLKCLCNL